MDRRLGMACPYGGSTGFSSTSVSWSDSAFDREDRHLMYLARQLCMCIYCIRRRDPTRFATSLAGGLEMNTLFRMGNEIQQTTRPLFNLEVEPPSSIDSCLPYPLFGIHNLGPQRGMARIFREEMECLLRSFLDSRRGSLVAPLELVRADESHPD